jgi:RNA polymerase sigma-70 factor (ECF subfamily)
VNDDSHFAAPDTAAMQALAAGQDTALHGLMDRWRDKVAAFLYRMCGSYDAALDLAEETFVRVYQARHRFTAGKPFSTWLFAIAANLARNHVRWRSRHPEVPLPQDDTRPDPGANPSSAIEAREQLRAVESAIAALPVDFREALVLSVYHELSHAEIAAALRCSTKAVERRISRARQQLREMLHGAA